MSLNAVVTLKFSGTKSCFVSVPRSWAPVTADVSIPSPFVLVVTESSDCLQKGDFRD